MPCRDKCLFKHVSSPGTYLERCALTRRVRWCAVRPQKRLGRPVEHRVFGTISISTWNWGKDEIYNSQYLACLPLFNPYIYTVSSLWIIKPTKVHLSTIYPISQLPFSPRKIVNLWTHNKSYKNGVLVRNKKETAIYDIGAEILSSWPNSTPKASLRTYSTSPDSSRQGASF